MLLNSGGSNSYLYNENSDRTTGLSIQQMSDQVIFSVASKQSTWDLVIKQYVLPIGTNKTHYAYFKLLSIYYTL